MQVKSVTVGGVERDLKLLRMRRLRGRAVNSVLKHAGPKAGVPG